jgi:hypothetical protein
VGVIDMAGIKGQMRQKPTAGARARTWTAMRVLGSFTIADVMATAEVTRQNASKYLVALERAGFLLRLKDNVSGRAGSHIRYRLVRNSGPEAPAVQTNGDVLDLNTGTRYSQGGEELGSAKRSGLIDSQPAVLGCVLGLLATQPQVGAAAIERHLREALRDVPGVRVPSSTVILRWLHDRRPAKPQEARR